MRNIVPIGRIEHLIFLIRGQKVMLSPHLAELYGVEPGLWSRPSSGTVNGFRAISCFN